MTTIADSRLGVSLTAAIAIAVLSLAGEQAHAACTFGAGSGEPGLQAQVDQILGGPSINVQTDCLAEGTDGLWETVNQLGMVTIQVELAGNAGTNTFGIYDPLTSVLTPVFEGNDGAGVFGLIQVWQNSGQWYVQTFDSHYSGGGDTIGFGAPQLLTTSAFGFYLGTLSNGTFFSQTVKNGDSLDHMYAYGPVAGMPFDYIIAWEDLITGQDRDYQDFVATLVDITPIPVPLPAAVWLMASGLLAVAGLSRNRAT